jgi:hypothetical protein
MKPGRELDALVAEKVVGLVRCQHECHKNENPAYPVYCHAQPDSPDQGGETQQYSSDMTEAWGVHRVACAWLFSQRRAYFNALTEIIRHRVGQPAAWPDLLMFLEPADICNAALRAVGVEVA